MEEEEEVQRRAYFLLEKKNIWKEKSEQLTIADKIILLETGQKQLYNQYFVKSEIKDEYLPWKWVSLATLYFISYYLRKGRVYNNQANEGIV